MYLNKQRLPFPIVNDLLYRFNSSFTPSLDKEGNIEVYARKLSEQAYFELYVDVEITGYIAYYINGSEHSCFITSVAVDENCRGTGIAYNLLSNLISSLPKEVATIQLEVAKVAIPALNLYKKVGFVVVEENEIKYKMRKELYL